MSVRRAQDEIDAPEFAEWMAYAKIEPFGPEREDQRAGVIAALIANVNRDSKSKPEPFTVEEFFPRYEDLFADLEGQSKGPEPATLESKLTAWAAVMTAANTKENRGHSDKASKDRGHGRAKRVAGRGRGGTQDTEGPPAV